MDAELPMLEMSKAGSDADGLGPAHHFVPRTSGHCNQSAWARVNSIDEEQNEAE